MLTRINDQLALDLAQVVGLHSGNVLLKSGHTIFLEADLFDRVNRAMQAKHLREMVKSAIPAVVEYHSNHEAVDVVHMSKSILCEICEREDA